MWVVFADRVLKSGSPLIACQVIIIIMEIQIADFADPLVGTTTCFFNKDKGTGMLIHYYSSGIAWARSQLISSYSIFYLLFIQ
jgi:hypothetical protein